LAHIGPILARADEFLWNAAAEAATLSGVVCLRGLLKILDDQGVVGGLLTIEHDSPLLGFYRGWGEPNLPVGLRQGRT